MIISLKGKTPLIDSAVWVALGTVVIGDVEVGAGSSIWFNVVIRSDYSSITIGENSSIQDNCVVHETPNYTVTIGNNVTVGHGAILHGCVIEDGALIGMGAIVRHGAKIGAGSIIAAGTLVAEKQVIPPKSMVARIPGRIIGKVSDETVELIKNDWAISYTNLWKNYRVKLDE